MKHFIITGGAGYIGSHTIAELLKDNDVKVISIDNYVNSGEVTYSRLEKVSGIRPDFHKVDLCEKDDLFGLVEKLPRIDGIIHFAALKAVPESVADPLLYYRNNIISLANILELCTRKHIEHFIFSSSCSVYGNTKALPVTEDTPIQQSVSPYGHTKQIGEEMIRYYCKADPSLKAVILRYFNPVGAHMSGLLGEMPIKRPDNLVPVITQTASGMNSLTVFGNDYPTRDGSCIRDYIHVSDIADAHIKALDFLMNGKNKEQVSLFNLGTGKGVSVLEAIRSFEKVSAMKLPYTIGQKREGDVTAIYANMDKAAKELGWVPKYDIDDMMLSAWKWQQYLNKGN